jgi:K+-sensing histidine kinase KdpD
MEVFEGILNKINFPIVIWKKSNKNQNEKKNALKCFYSNEKLNIKKDTTLDEYILNNKIEYSQLYDNLDGEQCVQTSEYIIVFDKLDDSQLKDIYYEIHYPKCSNINILNSISTKIRRPLFNIVGVLSLIDELDLTEEQKKNIEIIKKSSYDIVGVVNDIVDIINLEQNKIKLNNDKVSLQKLVTDACEIVSDYLHVKNLTMKYRICDDLPDVIIIDKARLQQVIINLLNNSIKHTTIGAIVIEVQFNKNGENNRGNKYDILFKIQDTGHGIDEQQQKFVDSLLDVTDITTYAKFYKGSGFGLLICNYLCNIMGGKIWYKTHVDMGTMFYFNIICEGIYLDK